MTGKSQYANRNPRQRPRAKGCIPCQMSKKVNICQLSGRAVYKKEWGPVEGDGFRFKLLGGKKEQVKS